MLQKTLLRVKEELPGEFLNSTNSIKTICREAKRKAKTLHKMGLTEEECFLNLSQANSAKERQRGSFSILIKHRRDNKGKGQFLRLN